MKNKFINTFESFDIGRPVTEEYQKLLDELEDVIRNLMAQLISNPVQYSYMFYTIHEHDDKWGKFSEELGLFTNYFSGTFQKLQSVGANGDDKELLVKIVNERQYSKYFMFDKDSDDKIIKKCVSLILTDLKFLNIFLNDTPQIFKYVDLNDKRKEKITNGYESIIKKGGKLDKILESRLKKSDNKFKFFNDYSRLFSDKLRKKYDTLRAASEFGFFAE